MSKFDNLQRDSIERVLTEVYGLSREQYLGYNSDYQKFLMDNLFNILGKRNRDSIDETSIKQKKKTLFRKK